jgi:hypothetical protein
MDKIYGAYIVSFSFSNPNDTNASVVVVCKQTKGKVEVVNAFQGKEAWDLYQKLTVKKEGASK